MTDYYVLVNGRSAPQLRALAQGTERSLREQNARVFKRSGSPESEWIVLDYIDIVVHIFSEQAREYYSLETLWKDARVLEYPESLNA